MRQHPTRKIYAPIALFISLILVLLILRTTHHTHSERTILLSFDVEPVDEEKSALDVLEVLREENVNATFFVTGEYAEKHPRVVMAMRNYEVGCHGYSHKPFTSMNTTEKQDEIDNCSIIATLIGRKPVGFRAPYNQIDKETLKILEQEEFIYDASMINGLGLFFPGVKGMLIGEVPVSSILAVPLEDVVWLHYLSLEKAFFHVLEHKNTPLESYLFHPHHIAKRKQELRDFITHLKKENVTFISHYELIMKHEGV